MTVILWYRRDLRLADHPALQAALAHHKRVIPVFVWDPAGEGEWSPGAAARWWLHHSLASLQRSLQQRGSGLVLRRGPSARVLLELARETGATSVYWSRRYEPAAHRLELEVETRLRGAGVEARSFPGALLVEPDAVATRAGRPYRVFTPYWSTARAQLDAGEPTPAPKRLPPLVGEAGGESLASLGLMPRVAWYEGMDRTWTPGEAGAHARLERFARYGVPGYAEERNRADREGSSRLSPHLAWGEVSPRQVLWAVKGSAGAEAFLRQLGWREFSYHLLWHFPESSSEAMDPRFRTFPWRSDPVSLACWEKGLTGIPLVDAGMRELWTIGWLHNRLRMVVASFLTKNLLIPWQTGARWFWDTLVDADLANNTQGWQWTAGCGVDAAPYFRIFNPVRQAESADPTGAYVTRWVPELAPLPKRYVHRPWEASETMRACAGKPPYPAPIVDLLQSRRRALEVYGGLRGTKRRQVSP